jgi:hypothetical protein
LEKKTAAGGFIGDGDRWKSDASTLRSGWKMEKTGEGRRRSAARR